jgi:hypothetical protein
VIEVISVRRTIMNATVVYHDRSVAIDKDHAGSDSLWIRFEDLQRSFGWTARPEGVCRGEMCVPIPLGRESEFVRDAEWFNLAAFSRLLGDAVVYSDDLNVWVILEAAPKVRGQSQSLEAPDFGLPDLDGRVHQLSDYRGNKVFLFAWASW